MQAGLAFDFQTYHSERQVLIEENLSRLFDRHDPSKLWESMRYSVLLGGKRIRATLCLAAAELVALSQGIDNLQQTHKRVLPCACAIEMIHAMSLMHDDLPCMDNDDFRRGKPSNHKVFGEDIALLAGDNLLVYAFETILTHTPDEVDLRHVRDVCRELAASTGAGGMVGGQVLDMALTGNNGLSADQSDKSQILSEIHKRKTGALIKFSVWSGAKLAGATPDQAFHLSRYGEILGLSFQIADDLLDVAGDMKTLGKTPGKDQAAGKLTWVSVFGEEVAIEKLDELEREGQEVLSKSGLVESGLKPLNALLSYAIHRSH